MISPFGSGVGQRSGDGNRRLSSKAMIEVYTRLVGRRGKASGNPSRMVMEARDGWLVREGMER